MASNKATVKENTVTPEDPKKKLLEAVMQLAEARGGMKPVEPGKTNASGKPVSYTHSRNFGQVHVTDDRGHDIGIGLHVFDYGVKMDKKQAVQAVSRTEKAAAQALGITVEEFREKYVNA